VLAVIGGRARDRAGVLLTSTVLAVFEPTPELDFARSGGPTGDEEKALEENGGDFRALRVGP